MNKRESDQYPTFQVFLVTLLALGLYLPFLAIQYDPNGIVEAVALETRQLVNKNHMLYRPMGFVIFRTLQWLGYQGRSLELLQILNAICGAAGVGLAYSVFKWATRETTAALIGCFLLATSFTYWIFSTDAAYITVAGMFALAAMASIVHGKSQRSVVLAAVLTSLSILTWQAGVFLIPALIVLLITTGPRSVTRRIAVFVVTIAVTAGTAYLIAGFSARGLMGPKELWTWFTNYSENGVLPLWGTWGPGRFSNAAINAGRSVLPILLAVNPLHISRSIQLGRILVDVACVAFVLLFVLAVLKLRLRSFWFLFGYALFIPFIVWWDPFVPKWFFVPNIFLAGFLSCGLQPWLRQRRTALLIGTCAIIVASANFLTTIHPRHAKLGPDRTMAQCVAEHMQPRDVFIAAEWGWPDYLGYLHGREELNLLNETAYAGTKERMLDGLKPYIASRQQEGDLYMSDPHSYTVEHLALLRGQTQLTLQDLLAFGGTPAFTCSGTTINKLVR